MKTEKQVYDNGYLCVDGSLVAELMGNFDKIKTVVEFEQLRKYLINIWCGLGQHAP